jgi:hypothetical protein
MLFVRLDPDNIAGPDFFDGPSFALDPTQARCDDESLTERMRMPCSPCARLKSYAGTLNKGWVGCLE